MPKFACPICHDPNGFPIWIDAEPPEGCPHDESWMEGRPLAIKSVAECPYQRGKAEQRARWMKLCPEAFDANGNLVEGGLVMVLEKLPPDGPPVII